MSTISVNQLLDERAGLLQELAGFSSLLRGSWLERFSLCSKKDCKCHRGERHGPRRYLVVNDQGRQKQKYIPNAQAQKARGGIEQYHRAMEIFDRITAINLALMKENAYEP